MAIGIAGDYVVPEDDGAGGNRAVAVAAPDFDQYRRAVGKVWATAADGRPIVAVKIG